MKDYTIQITLNKREKDSKILNNNSYDQINFIIQLREETHERALIRAVNIAREKMNEKGSEARIVKAEIIDFDILKKE